MEGTRLSSTHSRTTSRQNSELSGSDESEEPTAAEVATKQLLGCLSSSDATDALGKLCQMASDKSVGSANDILSSGIVSAVTLTMRTFAVAAVQYRALSALRAFSVTPELRSEIIRQGGLETVLALMGDDESLTVQDRGATIIANLAVGCAHRKRKLAREGALDAVVRAMRMFTNDVQMQLRGSLALRNMAHNAQVNQYIAGKAGAVEAVLNALLKAGQQNETELLYQTVAALESMCTQDKMNRSRIVERELDVWSHERECNEDSKSFSPQGSPQASHQASPESQADYSSQHANVNGSENDSGQLENDTSGITQPASPSSHSDKIPHSKYGDANSMYRILLRAIRKMPDNRPLLKYSLSLLALTSWKQQNVQKRLGELGGVEIALATVKRYEKDIVLVTRSCSLLSTLCLIDENRVRVHKGLSVLLSAIEDHGGNPSAIREIAAAVSNALYRSPRNRDSVLARGGAQTVSQLLIQGECRDLRTMEAFLCTLRNLVDGRKEGALQCARENCISAVRAALDATKELKLDDEKRVSVQAILLLGDLAKSAPGCAIEMRSVEVGDWVENALCKLEKPKYHDAHVVGDELISFLNQEETQGGSALFNRPGNIASEKDFEASHSFSFSARWTHTRGLFQSITSSLTSNKRSTEPPRSGGARRGFGRRSRSGGERRFLGIWRKRS